MPLTAYIFAALAGILLGGVVNILADDLPRRRIPIFPPRYPDGTPRPMSAWLGISAFLLGKRVTPSGSSLSWRYPLAELFTAGLFVLTLAATADDPKMTQLQLVFWLAYMVIFALITVIDLEHRLILFVVVIPAWGIALLDAATTNYGADFGQALIGGAVGFGVFFLLYLGGFLFVSISGTLRGHSTTEVAFGYGDVLLITLSGFMLGWQPLIPTMFLTVFLGALGALAWILSRSLSRTGYSLFTPLPYGQYIVIATIILLLFATELTAVLYRPT
ncbi:MAG: A24 family peptidase [Anaerolineae bacterium]|nr:A24 family peptidase [Anaerolineae bacterium]NUQ02572.1 prepilin peptidase [Anaerolineae bacterium]